MAEVDEETEVHGDIRVRIKDSSRHHRGLAQALARYRAENQDGFSSASDDSTDEEGGGFVRFSLADDSGGAEGGGGGGWGRTTKLAPVFMYGGGW